MQEDKEKKRLEALERKKENQRLLDEEDARTKGKAKELAAKMTRAQIEETLRKEQEEKPVEVKEKGENSLLFLLHLLCSYLALLLLLNLFLLPSLASMNVANTSYQVLYYYFSHLTKIVEKIN